MDAQLSQSIAEGMRVLFLFAVPALVAVTLAALLGSALQATLAIHEPVVNYAVRVVAFVFALYALFPEWSRTLTDLTTASFSG